HSCPVANACQHPGVWGGLDDRPPVDIDRDRRRRLVAFPTGHLRRRHPLDSVGAGSGVAFPALSSLVFSATIPRGAESFPDRELAPPGRRLETAARSPARP